MQIGTKTNSASPPPDHYGPNGPITTTVGLLGLFGLYEDVQTSFQVLSPIFKGAHSPLDMITHVLTMNHLQQGGFVLYAGFGCLSAAGLVWAITNNVRHFCILAHDHYHRFAQGKRHKKRK